MLKVSKNADVSVQLDNIILCQWKLPEKSLTWKRRNEIPLCHTVQGMRYVQEHVEISGSKTDTAEAFTF